ncbi:DivIVA domain-containing protein [Micromonospora sp. NBC_00898]|uniref:DivIVA domain-containing protein n=1 Tax=Micromonospora sp. NBC_00898 TaxID=2975981 RepID=UPI00386B5B6C|nr:DivIVA domain-containing protein [Micromonospora sp. NBC_00898]
MTGFHGTNAGFRIDAETVRSVEFERIGRGYRAEDVDAFLHAVAAALAEADTERAALRAELYRLRNWYRHHGVRVDPPDPPAGAIEPPPAHAWQARAMADQAAWDYAASAGAAQYIDPGDPVRLAEWSRAYGRAIETHLRAVTEAFAFEAARLAGAPVRTVRSDELPRPARPAHERVEPAPDAQGPWVP